MSDALTIAFVGDVSLGGDTRRLLRERGVDYWFEGARDELASCDLRIGNFECTLLEPERAAELAHLEMAVPRPFGMGFRNAGFDIVTLANNHVMDCGPEGLETTTRFLDEQGIVHFGAGRNRAEAERTVYYEAQGRRIALLGVCDASYHFAGADSPGIAPLDLPALGARVRAAAAEADLVMVHVHADLEFTAHPSVHRVRYSRWLAEQGAHLVIEHHPHVFQGIERHEGSLIAYSLGNFVFDIDFSDYMRDREGMKETFVLKVKVDFSGERPACTYEAVPFAIGADYHPLPVVPEERAARIAALERLSADLARPAVLRSAWRRRALQELKKECFDLYYALRKHGARRAWKDFRDLCRAPHHRPWLRGAFTLGFF